MPAERASVSSSDDPLTMAMQPPPDESPEDRQQREESERAAQLRSDSIDEYLKSEGKKAKVTKLLLLGQSESGKSTTLKVMKMLYAKDHFADERMSWKAIVQLNLIRHVLTILKVLEEEATNHSPSSTLVALLPDTISVPSHDSSLSPSPRLSTLGPTASPSANPSPSRQTAFHHTLRLRLAPLAEIESNLAKQLAQSSLTPDTSKGPTVHSYTAWMKHFGYKSSSCPSASSSQAASPASTTPAVGLHFEEEAGQVINVCKDDIAALWKDKLVRELLRERRVKLELEGGFFLDDLDRVCELDYEPTDLDVCKARLKTMGVTETNFRVVQGAAGKGNWKVYDVGGSRTLRNAWVPFFDDVNAILFLAPISAFDQRLEEDPSVYRIEDSMLLWREICRNKLLVNVDFILFLNKVDLLKKKLESGIRIDKYFTRYKGPNTVTDVCEYFKRKFISIHREALKSAYAEIQNPAKNGGKAGRIPDRERIPRIHCTSVIDTDATKKIIHEVQDFIFTGNVKSAYVL